jgi:hypothetical protein
LLCRLVGVDASTTQRGDAAIEGSSLPATRSAVPLVAAHRRLAGHADHRGAVADPDQTGQRAAVAQREFVLRRGGI